MLFSAFVMTAHCIKCIFEPGKKLPEQRLLSSVQTGCRKKRICQGLAVSPRQLSSEMP